MNVKSIRVGSVLLGLFLAMIFNGIALWSYWSYVSLETVLTQEKQKMQVLKEDIALTKIALLEFEEEKARFESVLFNERDIPAFLDEISENATDENVHIVSMRTKRFHQVKLPEDVSKKRNHMMATRNRKKAEDLKKLEQLKRVVTLSALPISIKLKGTFSALVKFLNRLEGHKQLTNISDVEITRGRDYPYIQCEFVLRIYSLKTLGQYQL